MSCNDAQCFGEWFEGVATKYPHRPALAGIDGSIITYAQLHDRVHELSLQLHTLGIGAGQTVAVALPDGPAAFVAMLAVARTATLLPLNYHDPAAEIAALFEELHPALVIVPDTVSPAHSAADSKSIPRIVQTASDASFIRFSWMPTAVRRGGADPEMPHLETPLIRIATAGSTSKPKIVSLTHRSIFISINHAAEWMQVGSEDRALCVMPFCHVHSFVRSTFPALSRGAEIIAAPGFDPVRMTDWIDRLRPSYFTASPNVYRGLLRRAEISGWQPAHSDLRLLVTGSDAIDPATVKRVQQLLRAPLKQFYGLSEVSPLIAVTPQSMNEVPEGAVGRINPVWSLQCLDKHDQPVGTGQPGQIAVRGGIINPVVNADDTAKRVRNGWFLTGDMGYLDSAGYLYFTGRVDDRINRAGKKISVGSIEAVLREIPGVADAVVFAVPDSEYGQRVGAAVVCSNERLKARDIREAAALKLSHDRLPEHVVITDRLPLSAAGKIQRSKLADYYQLPSGVNDPQGNQDAAAVGPRHAIEEQLAGIWCAVLGIEAVGTRDDFFELGGNSLLAMQICSRIHEAFKVDIPLRCLFETPTVAGLSAELELESFEI